MLKVRIDMRQVKLPKTSWLGFFKGVAKPGNWITWYEMSTEGQRMPRIGRVIGRIAEAEPILGQPYDYCVGWIVVMRLSDDLESSWINWVDPEKVTTCSEKPPHALLKWITSPDWVKKPADAYKLIAMVQHGTTADRYIDNRDNPSQAYNARPEYIAQFVLE